MLGLTAEWERDNIRNALKQDVFSEMKEGHWAGGSAPFGYDYNRETKNLVINENEAEIVRMIYDLYASGKSLGAITDQLNQALISPRCKTAKDGIATGTASSDKPAYKGETIVNRHCHISDIKKVDLSKAIKMLFRQLSA